LRFLVGWQRRVIPICAHTALQHAPGLADLSLLFGIAVVVETEVEGHGYRLSRGVAAKGNQ
jgi:hypothetical protein